MGDRAVIQITQYDLRSPALYLHWHGNDVPALLAQWEQRFYTKRGNDIEYGFARLVQYACEMAGGNGVLSVGVRPTVGYPDGQGDAGVFIVDLNTHTITQRDGYAPDLSAWPELSVFKWDAKGREA